MAVAVLHLLKLSVGTSDIAHLAAWQAMRAAAEPPLRHQTRQRPKRAAEIIDGGSIYWVIQGILRVRQRIIDITDDIWDDGTTCSGLVLDPILVPVAARPIKPFQGWRYLDPAAAPPDIAAMAAASGIEALPPAMRAELQLLGLL